MNWIRFWDFALKLIDNDAGVVTTYLAIFV